MHGLGKPQPESKAARVFKFTYEDLFSIAHWKMQESGEPHDHVMKPVYKPSLGGLLWQTASFLNYFFWEAMIC